MIFSELCDSQYLAQYRLFLYEEISAPDPLFTVRACVLFRLM
jgi:hypothetical protein